MSAIILQGQELAEQIYREVRRDCARFAAEAKRKPRLAAVTVGDNPQSAKYVASKGKRAEKLGMDFARHTLSEILSQRELEKKLSQLSRQDDVDAILLQLPLPGHLDPDWALDAIDPQKDVDGLCSTNCANLARGSTDGLVPCTPAGCLALVRWARQQLGEPDSLAGLEAVVIGRSKLVGRPAASLLLNEGCTVTHCHSLTGSVASGVRPARGLAEICRDADILIVAAGRPSLVTGDFIKPGAIVIDVGLNYGPDGICGDVERRSVEQAAAALTPVPGGVGPLTVAMLMRNAILAATLRRSKKA